MLHNVIIPLHITCTASAIGTVVYINYQFSPLDNISFRPEFYDDKQGQRTGIKTRYLNFTPVMGFSMHNLQVI